MHPDHSARRPDAIDHSVGQTIRKLRLAANMSQETLAARVGVTFQQLQKYENGQNRVSASRLLQLATALGARVEAFFTEVDHARARELHRARMEEEEQS